MIKDKTQKIGLVIICLLFVLASCKKIIDRDIIQSPTAANAFRAPSDINHGLAGAYNMLRTFLPDQVFLFGDIQADNFNKAKNVGSRMETDLQRRAGVNDLIQAGAGNWNGYYTTISQCNLILEKIPTISGYTAGEKERYLGEARFLRALSYFYLVRLYGGVPLIMKSVDISNVGRSTQEEIFKAISDDLDAAISNLEVSYSNADRAVRADKGAAKAIKAHLMGWMHKYDECEKLCNEVITSGKYSLVRDSTALLNIFVGKSPEGIFELDFDSKNNELQKNKMYNRTLGRPWYKDQSDGGGGTDEYVLGFTPAVRAVLFPKGVRDIRRDVWFIKSTWDSEILYFGKYRTLKAQGDTTSQNINESNLIITRLSDIILLRAEALDALNRPGEAMTELNKIRERAKRPNYTGGGILADTILLERRKELMGEGQYFFDLVRTRKMAKLHSKIKQADWYEKGAWLLPISSSIIAASNYVITQNEFWK
ncbi:RagB/SusD family nutrient uptake outer membrane protein [Pedobacter caeni]|uniref:SusD family protein n=1 Tax=Pedobacter caeni TaxID=288992 RepID=A0A1M5H018_9SPHI|nr:RagB/SusD family nutrient uptake outer membrane protein [Pedobacter caeni]SHG09284.1 SusD family protein [Pedobacter caeni]